MAGDEARQTRNWKQEVLEVKGTQTEGRCRIDLQFSSPVPAEILRLLILQDGFRQAMYSGPPVCLMGHALYSGIWHPRRYCFDSMAMQCEAAESWDSTPGVKGTEDGLTTKQWTVEMPTGNDENGGEQNICFALQTPEHSSQPCTMCIAPRLHFHSRMTVLGVNEIDTVAQSFKADVFVEFRARRIAREDVPQEVVEFAIKSYGLRSTAQFSFLNMLEAETEAWSSVSSSVQPGFVDYCSRRKVQARFSDRMDLQKFPFDRQDLMITATLNHPTSQTILVENREFPSKFLHQNFQLNSIWEVPSREQVEFEAGASDPSESAAHYQYPRAEFHLLLNRKAGYYISNVALPMAVLTYMSVLSGAVEVDGSYMGTADRLSVTLTLVLTAVAYKFVVAAAIPQVSYLTELDRYVLVCFLFMVLAAVENVVFPAFLIDRSDPDDIREHVREVWLILAFLGLFTVANAYFLLRILRLQRRNRVVPVKQIAA